MTIARSNVAMPGPRRRYPSLPKIFSNCSLYAGNRFETFDACLVRVAHLDRVGDRAHGLRFERGGAAVPELRAAQDAVVADRRIAAAHLIANADAELRVPREAFVGIWQLAQLIVRVGRKPRVEIKLAAQLDLGPRERVLVDALHLAVPAASPSGSSKSSVS